MSLFKFRIQIFSLLLFTIAFTSCKGQTSTNRTQKNSNSTNQKEEHPKIVRTFGTQSENVVGHLLDKNGNLWFSIRGEGAYRYDGKSFTNFTTKDGLCSNNVGSIIQDKAGNILFGTNRGLCKYDGNAFINIPMTDTLNITSLLEDQAGNIWFGVMNNGIYRYDGKNIANFLYKYEHPFFGEKYEKYISDIIQDRNGNLWFSSWNGGGVWKYDGKSFKHFLPSLDYYNANQDNRRNSNAENALNFIQNKNKSFIQTQDYISDDMIFSMTEDHLGNIWFATRNHGVCHYNGKIFTTIGIKEGFESEGAYAILEDKKGVFWFTTEKDGIWRYDGKTIKNFNEKDGLINNSVMNVLEDKEGNLWFGTKFFGLSRYNGQTFTTFSQYDK